MTEEALGARILSELKEESLGELIQSLRALSTPENIPTNFPPFSELLRRHGRPPILAHESRPPLPSPEPLTNTGPSPEGSQSLKPPIINITSIRSGSGKSQLLYYIIALTILPKTYGPRTGDSISLPGRNCLAVILDNDARFSISRLRQVMGHIVVSCSRERFAMQSLSDMDVEDILTRSLAYCHIFRPKSTTQLLKTLQALEGYLFTLRQPWSLQALGLLALDSMSAFYWPNRLSHELARLPTEPGRAPGETSPNFSYQVTASLKKLQCTFACPVIYTSIRGMDLLAAHVASLTLMLERIPVPKFPPYMGIDKACDREKELRWLEVEKGRFAATVVGIKITSTDDGMGNSEQKGTWLGFQITPDGISIESTENKGE